MSEKNLISKFLIEISKFGGRMFRNNSGVGWASDAEVIKRQYLVAVFPGDVIIRNARPLHAGLCTGSSDTIGWTPVYVTPAHVGQWVAVFTAVEFKTANTRTTEQQKNFIEAVKKDGGLAGVAHSVEDAVRICVGTNDEKGDI